MANRTPLSLLAACSSTLAGYPCVFLGSPHDPRDCFKPFPATGLLLQLRACSVRCANAGYTSSYQCTPTGLFRSNRSELVQQGLISLSRCKSAWTELDSNQHPAFRFLRALLLPLSYLSILESLVLSLYHATVYTMHC